MDNEILEFPKGHGRSAVLSNTAVPIATGAIRMTGFTITGGAGAKVVIFRSSGGSTEYFRWNAAATTSYHINKKAYYASGLEVLTSAAAGDVQIEVDFIKLSGGD